MERKDLRKTEGLPFTLGILSGILLLLSTVLSVNLTQPYTEALLEAQGLSSSFGSVGTVSNVISFLIDPGIFLILLILGKNKPKRGKTFAVVWIVISGISILSGMYSLLVHSSETEQLYQLVDAVMPGGMTIASVMSLLGSGCMLVSCIVFLQRFKFIPPTNGNQSTNGDFPSSQP